MIILTFCSTKIYSKNHIIWDGKDSGRQITQELLSRESPNHENPTVLMTSILYLFILKHFFLKLGWIFRGFPDVLNIFGTEFGTDWN